MRQPYVIERIQVKGLAFYVLKKTGVDSFIEKMANSPKKRNDLRLILKQLERIEKAGLDWAFSSETLKPLKSSGSPPVHELRCMPQTNRVMTYLHRKGEETILVLLFDFEGHKASKSMGGINNETLAKGHRLAEIAKELLEQGKGVSDGRSELDAGRSQRNG